MLYDPFILNVSGNDIVICPPFAKLIPDMTNVTMQVWRESPWTGHSYMDDPGVCVEQEEKYVNNFITDPKLAMFCILYNNRYIGNFSYLIGDKFWNSHCATFGAGILAKYTNIGIASKLIPVMMEFAKQSGVQVMLLSAAAANERAVHVYRKVGFTEYGRVPGGYKYRSLDGEVYYTDDILMLKYL